jgi:agmatinase
MTEAEPAALSDTTLLVTNPDLALLSDGDSATIWHTKRAWRIKLGKSVARLWQAFAVPRTVGSVLATLPEGDQPGRQQVREVVAKLYARELLVRHDPAALSEGRRATGMFRAPVLPLAAALRGETADVVFIGAPYDVAVSYRPGARFAPDYLRRTGSAIFQYREENGAPTGAFDPVTGRWLLKGVRLADAGDINQAVHTRNGPTFDALTEVVAAVAGAGRLPVVLGGDHSITLPVVRGLLTRHEALGVLHFDAHSDYGEPLTEGWREYCHHGNVMNWIVGDERVRLVAQFGIRQLEAPPPVETPKRRVWPGRSASHVSPEKLLAELPSDIPYHLTIDVDALDPTVMPATGTPLPGGFTYPELLNLVELLCQSRRIVGIDLVELLPGPADTDGLLAADLLLRAVAAVMGQER